MSNSNVKISKAMSYILRHGASKEGIPIDKEGYVDISDLLSWLNKDIGTITGSTLKDIQDICIADSKNRYSIKGTHIRANQGHSSEVDIIFKDIDVKQSYPFIHGTNTKALESILKTGLKPMERQYVHLISCPYIDGNKSDVFSMIRQKINTFIVIQKSCPNRFFISDNGVIQTKDILPEYLTAIVMKPDLEYYGGIIFQDASKQKVLLVKNGLGKLELPRGKQQRQQSFCTALIYVYEQTNIQPKDITFISNIIDISKESEGYFMGYMESVKKIKENAGWYTINEAKKVLSLTDFFNISN